MRGNHHHQVEFAPVGIEGPPRIPGAQQSEEVLLILDTEQQVGFIDGQSDRMIETLQHFLL